MIRVAADMVLGIDETIMDILTGDELRLDTAVLEKDGADTFQLGSFFTIDQNPIARFYPAADIFRQEFEVFIKSRLGRNAETDDIFLVGETQRRLQEDALVGLQLLEEILFFIHIARIQPYTSLFRKDRSDGNGPFIGSGDNI